MQGMLSRAGIARALVLGLATVVGAIQVEEADAARPMKVKASAGSAAEGQAVKVRVRTMRSARCVLTAPVGRTTKRKTGRTDRRGRTTFKVAVSPNAPAGRYTYTVACRKGARRGKASASVMIAGRPAAVLPPGSPQPVAPGPEGGGEQSTGQLIAEPDPEPAGEGYGGGEPYIDGQCTRYAWRMRQDLPGNLGNAETWDERAAAQGFPVDRSPRVGDVAVWEKWTKGARQYGHVAYVEAVGNGTVTVSEWNWNGPYVKTVRTISTSELKFIHRKGAPPPAAFAFDDVHVHSHDTVTATAGSVVAVEVTARYASGPGAAPCGLLNLGVSDPRDAPAAWRHDPAWWPGSTWRNPARVAAAGCNGSVPVGGYARWRLEFRPPREAAAGVYQVGVFSPVWEGREWAPVRIPLRIRVIPAYRAQYVSQSQPRRFRLGESGDVEVRLKNTGPAAWDQQVHLGSLEDKPIMLASGGTSSGNRVPFAREGEGADGVISTGETAVFRYRVTAPSDRAFFGRQRFAMVRDGSGPWFAGEMGIYIPMLAADEKHFPAGVGANECPWKYITQSGSPVVDGRVEVTDSQPGRFALRIRNQSEGCPWLPEGTTGAFRLATDRPRDRGSGFASIGAGGWLSTNRIKGPGHIVWPGEEAEFNFELKPATWVPQGEFNEYVNPVLEGLFHLDNQAAVFVPVRRR